MWRANHWSTPAIGRVNTRYYSAHLGLGCIGENLPEPPQLCLRGGHFWASHVFRPPLLL